MHYISTRNLKFVLTEMLGAHTVSKFDYYSGYDAEAYEMALDAARQIADKDLFPYYMEMDRKKAICEAGVVTTHPQLKTIIQSVAEGGWIAAHHPQEVGGSQMPFTLAYAGLLTFYAANVNACYPFLTQGAANLIFTFGAQSLKDTYLSKMFSGDWQGTMALTEPQAGSSLSDITASASPTETEGCYKIRGQKIYISGGDHSACDNFVHLTLARIDGAPAGTKGISLFVVPKHRPNADGSLQFNDVTTAGIYGKMGQKGYTAAHLMFGEQGHCEGYLVGEPNKGLNYMFQMMNEARIGTGLVSAGAASAAYYASLKYANERPQGRKPQNKDVAAPQINIIEHADVRRMLLFQKAVVEGSISLLMQCSYYADLAHFGTGEEKEKAHLLLELLTPIAKSYPSEMGIHSVSAGMQVLGGAGYCDDFPIEQIYRDIRVNAIYEGTTGIHGMDLLGRKVQMEKGKAVVLFYDELKDCIEIATSTSGHLRFYAQQLQAVAGELHLVTQHLMHVGGQMGPEPMLADATLYLEYFGQVVVAWQWMKQATVAQKALDKGAGGDEALFYKSKMHAFKYFFEYELPKTKGLHQRLLSFEKVTLNAIKEEIV
jgi:alkylation response protein AidB-like acyl-CoA dehydrogenase